ncbi:MAG TPA: TIGR03621 family F420-dependent LLM class oxidoreductase [Acidimicrobiia bacterium]|nr:TIGR03621 family F420-dependent LLM class oxidoreductase [Acidimicrobiia bacterium]
MTARPIRFGVQANPGAGARAWLDLAIKAEDLGFDALYVADHVGATASPFAALSAAAAVTTTLRLGTYVLNCGIREPLDIASDAATLDQLSGGRVVLGLGAGHTPAEWTMSGRSFPSARDRVGRLAETVPVVAALLQGEVVTHRGRYLDLEEAALSAPRPVQAKIPLLVGGNGRELLRFAATTADIVGLTGLGRTLADGHRHEIDWRATAIDERVAIVRAAAASASRSGDVTLDALVQHVEITDRRDAAAEQMAGISPALTADDVIAAPYALVGTVDQLADEVAAHETRWGITSYVVRAAAIDLVAPLIERLRP